MLAKTFTKRLESWKNLRTSVQSLPLPQALESINKWWFQTPWKAYHLHWDDQQTWPDPWQLLDDNIYCGLARGLGIMYTIVMIDRNDMRDAVLAEIGGDNLVLVAKEKYILNWDINEIVNINLAPKKFKHSVSQQQLKQKIQ